MKSSIALTLLACVLAGARSTEARTYCATVPPPEGLVERCRSKTFFFPSSVGDEASRRVYLDVTLLEWMESCVISDRAPGLVYDDEAGVDRIFELMKDIPSMQFIRIVPEYTPLTFTEDGKTCYGVKSVRFRLPAAEGEVDLDGEIEISAGPSSDMIKEAAAAARKALQDPSVPGSASLSRFLSVLIAMENDGKDVDDTWYNVGPIAMGFSLTRSVPPACFSEFHAAGYECRPADEALAACSRHLADEIVNFYNGGKADPKAFAVYLQGLAEGIQRGIDYVAQVHGSTGGDILACSSIESVFAPRMNAASRSNSVYGRGQY